MQPRFGRVQDLLLVGILLLAAFLLELLVVPEGVLGLTYLIPILVAALRLSPGATVVAAVGAIVLYGVSSALGHLRLVVSSEHVLAHLVTLVAVASLGYLLAARIEQAQRAQREAKTAQRNLQNFLGMVAHDLRGPLTSILGYAQLLARPTTPAEVRARSLDTIQTEARRMDRLVMDLLDAARIGAGAFQVQPQPTDLVALTSQVVQTQQTSSPQHRIQLEAPDHLEGMWDPDRLAQVLNNLVGNAVKYSSGGGEVRVQLRREDDQASVSVSDQGRGIRPEDLPLLFQPFSRLYAGRETRGAGLGLYIAQGIVQAHGGRIWATSPGPGQGATFTFSLPLLGAPHHAGGTSQGVGQDYPKG